MTIHSKVQSSWLGYKPKAFFFFIHLGPLLREDRVNCQFPAHFPPQCNAFRINATLAMLCVSTV